MNVPFAALAMAVSDEKPVSVKSPEVIIMPPRPPCRSPPGWPPGPCCPSPWPESLELDESEEFAEFDDVDSTGWKSSVPGSRHHRLPEGHYERGTWLVT